jgi:predicted GNAT family acetyltransferase
MDGEFKNNTAQNRFEYHVNGATAFADYRRENGTLFIQYVEAPEALRGTGAAGKLMKYVADIARADGVKVVPVCGYAASWLAKHKEYADLL